MDVIPRSIVTHIYHMRDLTFKEKYPYPKTLNEIISIKKSKIMMVKLSPELKEVYFFQKSKKKGHEVKFYFWLPNIFNLQPTLECEIEYNDRKKAIDFIDNQSDTLFISEAFRILSLYDHEWK